MFLDASKAARFRGEGKKLLRNPGFPPSSLIFCATPLLTFVPDLAKTNLCME
jgi:hypothetical protein